MSIGKQLPASDLNMKATRSSIMLVTVYQSTWCHIPKYLTPHQITISVKGIVISIVQHVTNKGLPYNHIYIYIYI